MKYLFTTIIIIATTGLNAQSLDFTVVNNECTDYVFFDMLKIDMNTGKVTNLYRSAQAFGGVLVFEGFKLSESEELLIQKRTRDRQFVDEFSARVSYSDGYAKFLLIETPSEFKVNCGGSAGDAYLEAFGLR
tara:strand:- start:1330 stop:1725 length:396 start_codon:yes stop_codon:yes gene_type:complete